MTTNSRRGLRLAGAGGLGALLIFTALIYFDRETATPAAAPQSAAVTPAAPEQAPPKAQAQPLQPIAVAKGVRQDYIVQASSIELARNAVTKAGGVITGELEIIRAVGASLDDRELDALQEKPVAGL